MGFFKISLILWLLPFPSLTLMCGIEEMKQKQMGERGAEPLEDGRLTGASVFAL